MTAEEIMAELKAMGSDSLKKILLKHGVKEPFFGVKVEQLKTIQKKVKTDYQLGKDLYATGNADAQYLAGLIADDEKMTRDDLQSWVQQALSNNISEYTVPWVAAGNPNGFELASNWIDSQDEHVAAAGWSTLSNWVALRPDDTLDIPVLKMLLDRVVKTIHSEKNRVRSMMNGFIIALGIYVTSLTEEAINAAKTIGSVTVDMDGTACKVPDAQTYIQKAKDGGVWGKKKKMVKC
jgi:hypothetical protein